MSLNSKCIFLMGAWFYLISICFVSKNFCMDLGEDSHNLKVILVGDTEVGKSCIIERYVDDKFCDKYKSTISFEFCTKTVEINGKNYKLQIWDTAGQEQFRTLIIKYFKDSNVVIFVYDVTNKKSFENIDVVWRQTVEKEINKDEVIFALVGNKTDLQDKRQVFTEEGEKFAAEHKMLFFEVSAKTGERIDEIFTNTVERYVENFSHNIKEKFQILMKENEEEKDKDNKNNSCCCNLLKSMFPCCNK